MATAIKASDRARIQALLSEAASAVRPLPKTDVVEWCEKYRVLSAESSNEPGPWRVSRAPYTAEIMRAVYVETLTRIERRGYDVFTSRTRVPRPRQALIAFKQWLRT